MNSDRRAFLTRLAAVSALTHLPIPFAERYAPAGWVPLALAADGLEGKPGLRLLNDRPLNAEAKVGALDPSITPTTAHFVRNNGLVPKRATEQSLEGWSLTIDGEVNTPLTLSMAQLKAEFETITRALVLECGGNGRAGYRPAAKGNQWTLGAVACSEWTGVRLADVLARAGVTSKAVYLAYYGEDTHISGDPKKVVISRGCPIRKALEADAMLAWGMNGAPLPALHGFPLRLMVPGYPASASGKWLKRLWIRDQVHDGPKMTGTAYRVPRHPVAPGTKVDESDMAIIEQMPVKSLITRPGSGVETTVAKGATIRGHAWSGAGDVTAVHVSHDFGQTWSEAALRPPANRFAWQDFEATLRFDTPGYYEVWARATDVSGRMQPMLVPGWNPKGYLNNAMHRIAVVVR